MVAVVACRLCGDRHVSVYPADIAEEENMECPTCGHMTCEPKEYIPPNHGPKKIPPSAA